MSLIAIMAAFTLEQLFPLTQYAQLRARLRGAIERVEEVLVNEQSAPWQAFWFVALFGTLTAGLLFVLLDYVHPMLGLLFTVAVLYLTVGVRQFSGHFTRIRNSMAAGDLAQAKLALAAWKSEEAEITGYRGHVGVDDLSELELVRQSLEMAMLSSLRYVFAGLFWFLMLATVQLGVMGVVLYRLADIMRRRWSQNTQPQYAAYGRYAQKMLMFLEFLPARFAALVFAIVGNFELAIHCWRHQSEPLRQMGEADAAAVVLTSGAGALNVVLREGAVLPEQTAMDEHEMALYQGEGDGAPQPDAPADTTEHVSAPSADAAMAPLYAGQIGSGDTPSAATMHSAISLFWRAAIFVVFVLLLMTLSKVLA